MHTVLHRGKTNTFYEINSPYEWTVMNESDSNEMLCQLLICNYDVDTFLQMIQLSPNNIDVPEKPKKHGRLMSAKVCCSK